MCFRRTAFFRASQTPPKNTVLIRLLTDDDKPSDLNEKDRQTRMRETESDNQVEEPVLTETKTSSSRRRTQKKKSGTKYSKRSPDFSSRAKKSNGVGYAKRVQASATSEDESSSSRRRRKSRRDESSAGRASANRKSKQRG